MVNGLLALTKTVLGVVPFTLPLPVGKPFTVRHILFETVLPQQFLIWVLISDFVVCENASNLSTITASCVFGYRNSDPMYLV